LDAQAALRKERVDRERRLEGLAVEALTALGNETRRSPHPNNAPGPASQAMINDEHLTVPETVRWWLDTLAHTYAEALRARCPIRATL
jgi:hypothetical protein